MPGRIASPTSEHGIRTPTGHEHGFEDGGFGKEEGRSILLYLDGSPDVPDSHYQSIHLPEQITGSLRTRPGGPAFAGHVTIG